MLPRLNPPVAAMNTVTWTILVNRSNEPPSASRSTASACSAARSAAAAPSCTETSPPRCPGDTTTPSTIGTCPATNARPPLITQGT
jgi:hypothetical protein